MKTLSFQEKINNFKLPCSINKNNIKEYMTEKEVRRVFHKQILGFNPITLNGAMLNEEHQLIVFHKCKIYKQTKNPKWVNGGFDNIKFEDMGLVEIVDGYKLEIKEI